MGITILGMQICAGCGQHSPPVAKFCVSCGVALSAHQPPVLGRPVIPMEMSNPAQLTQPFTYRDSNAPQPSGQLQDQPVAFLQMGNQPSTSKSRTKLIAIAVIAFVVIATGIMIFASGNDYQPEQAKPSAAQVVPDKSDTSEEAATSDNDPTQNYLSWDDFPGWYRSNFLEACAVEGAYASCLCALETMEANFTLDEVLEVEEAESYGEDVTWFYSAIVAECV